MLCADIQFGHDVKCTKRTVNSIQNWCFCTLKDALMRLGRMGHPEFHRSLLKDTNNVFTTVTELERNIHSGG